MKYIRTTDGIYDLEHSIIYKFNGIRVKTPYCLDYEINTVLCKTANTLEELCDVVVSIKKHKGTVVDFDILWSFLNWREELGEEIAEGAEIYGAIWTDKGLIYVAKMNEKGELELL